MPFRIVTTWPLLDKNSLNVGDGCGECIFGQRDDVKDERSDDDVGRRDGFTIRLPKNAVRTRNVAVINPLKKKWLHGFVKLS